MRQKDARRLAPPTYAPWRTNGGSHTIVFHHSKGVTSTVGDLPSALTDISRGTTLCSNTWHTLLDPSSNSGSMAF